MSFPLVVYYGPGKGKSTASYGCMLRCLGHNEKVLLVQFIKKPNTSGEQNIVSKIGIDYYCAGKGFVFPTMSLEQRGQHRQAAKSGVDYAKRYLAEHDPGLIVLDELLHIFELFPDLYNEAYQLITAAAEKCTTIVTGRNLPDPIKERADYVYYVDDQKPHQDMECVEGFHI